MKAILYLLIPALLFSYSSAAQEEQKPPSRFMMMWEKGIIHYNVSLPIGTGFDLSTPDEHYLNGNGLGIATGFNYMYRKNRFLSAQAGTTGASLSFAEYFPDSTGWLRRKRANSMFFNLKNNHHIVFVDAGYGVSVTRHKLTGTYINDSLGVDSTTNYVNWGGGAAFSLYIPFSYFLYGGVVYQPQFFSFSDGFSVKYEHTISVHVQVRFGLKSEKGRIKRFMD